jgi:arsenate reductase
MKKIYHLGTCNTCERLIKDLNLPLEFVYQDIKTSLLSEDQLEVMYKLAGSYEALFSKRARLYKERGLKHIALNETDYKRLILEHYTFLKRPVIIANDRIFIGNSSKVIEAAKAYIGNE